MVRFKVSVRFRSEICKLRTHHFEIVQRILQIAQIHKSRNTAVREVHGLNGFGKNYAITTSFSAFPQSRMHEYRVYKRLTNCLYLVL